MTAARNLDFGDAPPPAEASVLDAVCREAGPARSVVLVRSRRAWRVDVLEIAWLPAKAGARVRRAG